MTDKDGTEASETEAGATKIEKKATSSKKKAVVEAVTVEPKVFAIVRTGGKQYRVSPGTKLSIEKLELEVGSSVTFEEVLMAGTEGGADTKILAGTEKSLGITVTGKVIAQKKDKKVIIFKKRRRGGYTKKQGHRQQKTEVLIDGFSL